MSVQTFHENEEEITTSLVSKLISSQFPEWEQLSLDLIHPEGTDNVMFKLGGDYVLRFPRKEEAAKSLEKERMWLPKLGSSYPIPIPEILEEGKPDFGYPFPWLVCRLLDGENLLVDQTLDERQAALDLGHFVSEFHKTPLEEGPSCRRGQPLSSRDSETRDAIDSLDDQFDAALLLEKWEQALQVSNWDGDPVWIHGDLHAGNLLAKRGKISAVLDFGLAGKGDPACDMMVAWTLLTSATREIFQKTVQPDEDTWRRGKGWALSMGVVAYPYYKETHPAFAKVAKQTIKEVLADG